MVILSVQLVIIIFHKIVLPRDRQQAQQGIQQIVIEIYIFIPMRYGY